MSRPRITLIMALALCVSQKVFAERHSTGTSSSARPTATNLRLNTHEPVDLTLIEKVKNELCPKDYVKADWDAVIPPLEREFTRTQAVLSLLRFQKKGGFERQEHLSLLNEILKESTFVKENILVVDQALEGVRAASPDTYKQMIDAQPYLFSLELREARRENPLPQCRNSAENQFFKNEAIKALEATKTKPRDVSEYRPWNPDYSNWKVLMPLRTSLNTLTSDEKDGAIHDLVIASSLHLGTDAELGGIFESKISHLMIAPLSPIFGMKPKHLTDLDAEANNGRVRVRALGNHPLSHGQNENRFGFFTKEIETFEVPRNSSATEKKYEWENNGKTYKGKITATPSSVGFTHKSETSFPYKELWSDNALKGFVMVGSNQANEAVQVLEQYKKFYEKHGYEFETSPTQSKDLLEELKKRITSGEIDYFSKEAHTRGDFVNIVILKSTGKLLKGTRKRPDGKIEEVTLAYPDLDAQDKVVSNGEFGKWIREREVNTSVPLVYMSSSCNSGKTKAANEYAAAASNGLIIVPSMSFTDPLENKEDNALYQFYDGFLAGDDYETIRTKMKKDPWNARKDWDWYIFPDEPDYDREIWNKLKHPVIIDVEMKDSSGRAFGFGENP